MSGVPYVDATAMENLDEFYAACREEEIRVIFTGVMAQPLAAMKKAGFYDRVGEENFVPNMDAACVLTAE